MKRITLLLVFFLVLVCGSSHGQTMMAVQNISISPSNPLPSSSITVVASGVLTATNVVINSSFISVTGNIVDLFFDVTAPGFGIGINVPFTQTFFLNPLPSGNYLITINGLYVADMVLPSSKQFTVSGPPPVCNANFTYSTVSIIPPPQNLEMIQFTDQSTGNTVNSWNWNFGDGTTSSFQNAPHGFSNLSSGQYNVCLTINTTDNCSDTYCEIVTINQYVPVCDANFDFYPDTISQGNPNIEVFNFQDLSTGSPAIAWNWDFGDGNFSTNQHPQHGYSNAIGGNYIVCLNILTSDSCNRSESSHLGMCPQLFGGNPCSYLVRRASVRWSK